jgi:hypothetical protein
MGFHLIRSIGTAVFLFLCSGCDDDKASVPMEPTSAEKINKAQQDYLSLISPLKIQQGEFVYFIKSQEVYTGQQEPSVTLMEEESLNVIERKEFPGYIEITLQKEVIDHLTEGSPHSIFKDVFYLETKGKTKNETLTESTASEEKPEVLFYNLKATDVLVSKPAKVLEKEPCPNSKECLLKARKISYDIVFTDPLNPQTTKVEAWLSLDVPYFASILKSCYTTVISIDTARPLVRQCKSVFDYQFK